MAPATSQAEGESLAGEGYIGRIPVRNLWLLMLYASDLYRTCGIGNVAREESPEDLPDLVGEILADAVERRQRRQLSTGYHPTDAILTRIRGRIDVLRTERNQLLQRGQVACHFDHLTVDTPRNRLVRGALECISGLVKRQDVAHRCRALAKRMKGSGVAGALPSRAEISTDRFGCNDAADRTMVEAAKLALDLALPAEVAGPYHLFLPDREIKWVRKLFEKAVANFYHVVLRPQGWEVRAQKGLKWQVERQSARINEILPHMQADVILDNCTTKRRIILDTKFTSILTNGWHREQSIRSGYLYQIYAYVRSQVGNGDPLADGAEGLLLHPSIGETVDDTAVIQGHRIRFATVDLGGSCADIRSSLEDIITGPAPATFRLMQLRGCNAI